MHTFKKIFRRATRGEILLHFFRRASRGAAWPLHFKFVSYAYAMVLVEKVRSSRGLWYTAARSGFALLDISNNSVVRSYQKNHSGYTVHIVDSFFEASMGETAVRVHRLERNSHLQVKFTDVIIRNRKGVGMFISNMLSIVLERVNFAYSTVVSIDVKNSEITLHDVLILKNGGLGGAVTLWRSKVTFLGHTVLAQNYGYKQNSPGALYAYSSTLIFHGKVEFVNNTGYNGGALALHAGSQIVMGRHAHIKFIGNHANHFGGAIYVDSYVLTDFIFIVLCFYKPADVFNISMNPNVLFENNTADYAGSALYGGWIDFCADSLEKTVHPDFNRMFQVKGGEVDPPVISSNPLRVCLCVDSRPECSITQYNTSVYPGTTIKLLVVAVGQRLGTVPSIVYSDFLYEFEQINEIHPNIKDWQYTQKAGKDCTNLTYTILSPPPMKLTMEVEVEDLDTPSRNVLRTGAKQLNLMNLELYLTNLLINIEILPCPLGFEYDNTSMTCTCDSKLAENEINCSIDTQTVWRKRSFWITTAEESGEVIVHEHCPFDYCKPESFDLDLEYPDEQCAFHRSGILCGACQHNLSYVFGTSACRECSSLWALLWVPVIALAGIALVVFLIVLNLTVSVGTINGLIFYANIVRANHATFFPPNTTNSFLNWFIAWINLDLGIETCFYSGLDAYVKTWLQFVFPLYIWFLVITIIVLSHYYTLAAKLSGRNAVQVLATLFLLSYAKLLQVLITAFSSTTITHSDGHQQTVWLYDGNINYLEGKHAVLFTVALLVLLFLSIPYTVLLVFTQYIQLKSNTECLDFGYRN